MTYIGLQDWPSFNQIGKTDYMPFFCYVKFQLLATCLSFLWGW